MKSTLLIMLVVVGVCSTSCGKKVKEIDVSGNIFVVPKGRDNIKLGLVKVGIYPQNVILSHVQAKTGARDAALLEVKKGAEKCKKVVDSGDYGTGATHIRAYRDCLDGLESLKDNVNSIYFEDLPAPIAVATSDADGNFLLKVPKAGTYVLVAKSDRSITNERIEHYQWIVSLKVDEKSSSITLSNNNLLDFDSSPIAVIQSL